MDCTLHTLCGKAQRQDISHAWASFPCPQKHVSFDSRVLQGAPALQPLPQDSVRVIFVVNVRLNCHPMSLPPLPFLALNQGDRFPQSFYIFCWLSCWLCADYDTFSKVNLCLSVCRRGSFLCVTRGAFLTFSHLPPRLLPPTKKGWASLPCLTFEPNYTNFNAFQRFAVYCAAKRLHGFIFHWQHE
jgi:hypothetical protein